MWLRLRNSLNLFWPRRIGKTIAKKALTAIRNIANGKIGTVQALDMNEWQKWEWRRLSIWQRLERLLRGPLYIGEKPTPVWLRVAANLVYLVILFTLFIVIFGFLLDGDPVMFEP